MTGVWSKYKTQIVAAIIGALLSGVVSLAVGLFSLTKSFQYLQNKELLQQVRSDITLLRLVEEELDFSIQSLLSEPISVTIETENVGSWADVLESAADTAAQEPGKKEFFGFIETVMGGDVYRITKAELPRRQFYVEAWPVGVLGVSEIDFDLIQDINDLYRDLRRINDYIDDVSNINVGGVINKYGAEQL